MHRVNVCQKQLSNNFVVSKAYCTRRIKQCHPTCTGSSSISDDKGKRGMELLFISYEYLQGPS